VSRRDTHTEDANSLSAYLREISKLPRLTTDEERELGARIQHDRDETAVARLVESHLRFVVSYAKRYRGCGVPLLELIHEGNLGLIEAARRFNPARDDKFITGAVWWIRQSMMHAIAEDVRAICVPPKPIVDRAALGRPPAPMTGDDRTGDAVGRSHVSQARVRRIESSLKNTPRWSDKLRSHLN
jgi:DNA-directed RNA polymerase sigma subunit (sigma70/sigma32)